MAITLDGTNGITSPDFEPSGSTTPTNGLFLPTTNTLAWATNSTERLRLDSSGNLGLGVTPSAWGGNYKALQVGQTAVFGGNTAANRNYLSSNVFYDGSNYKYITSSQATQLEQSDGAFYWFNAPSGTAGAAISFTQAMTLDASGNLGVGTTSPAVRLEARASIAGGSDNTIAIVHNYSDTGGDTRYSGLSFRIGSDNGTSAIRAYRTNSANNYETNLSFWTNPSGATTTPVQRMTLDSSGNLLVGTTSYTTGKLVVQVKDQAYGGIQVVQNGGSTYWTQNVDSAGGYTFGKNSADFWYAGRSGSTNCVSIGGSWVNSSDERLKENIKPLENALAKVLMLRGVEFDRISTGIHEVGLIAQEVQKIYPEVVEDSSDMLGLNYGALIGPVVAAIKELTARLEALESK